MRLVLVLSATIGIVIAGVLPSGTLAAWAAGLGWEPTSDWCGVSWRYIYEDGTVHNGWDVWTLKSPATGGISGAKGFPVQLAGDGVLRQKYIYPGTTKAYGLRFWHPSLGLSTHYWHLGHQEADLSYKSYVEDTLVIGATYSAGTFLGYQGDLTTAQSIVTHLHLTVWNQDGADLGHVETSSNPGNAGEAPTGFIDRDLDMGQNGDRLSGSCWMVAQDVHYRGPLPETSHPYANDELRWYVIVNTDTSARVTRAEFCDLLTQPNKDYVRTFNYDLAKFDELSGQLTPPSVWSRGISAGSQTASRVMFIKFTSNSSTTDYGFRVCSVSSDPGGSIVEVFDQRTEYEDLTSPTQVVISYPTPPAPGDLLVAHIAVQRDGAVATDPEGWFPAVLSDPDQPYRQVGGIYYKIAGAFEPTTFAWTLAGTPNWAYGWASEWTGVSATPLDRAVENEGNSTTLSSGAVGTLAVSDELVIAVFRHNQTESVSSYNQGLTEIYETNTQHTIAIATKIATSTANVTYTANTSTSRDYAVLVATFKPQIAP